MKIRLNGKDYEIKIKEKYSKHQTKDIQFVMTRDVLIFKGEVIGVGSKWAVRDYKTGFPIITGKTMQETRKRFFMMVSSEKFLELHAIRTKKLSVLNE